MGNCYIIANIFAIVLEVGTHQPTVTKYALLIERQDLCLITGCADFYPGAIYLFGIDIIFVAKQQQSRECTGEQRQTTPEDDSEHVGFRYSGRSRSHLVCFGSLSPCCHRDLLLSRLLCVCTRDLVWRGYLGGTIYFFIKWSRENNMEQLASICCKSIAKVEKHRVE